ncbi:MAG TPA: hypothetical protein VGN26_06460 [Armatimonadota bacterium]|jgi:hypothetical protein
MVFKSTLVKAHWDNWCHRWKGTYYLYFLITEHSGGEGFGVATSPDGVHWEDHGWALRASDKMVDYLGTGAVWKAADFRRTGRFLCNYSEWRVEPGTAKKTQNILFAESRDLLHWTKLSDETMFRVDPEHYDPYGRWDCIYPMPRVEGGYWGTWTATARPDSPHQGIVGLGWSADGLHWTAVEPPEVTPGVGESGAFWRFGDRIHAMFGAGMTMWSYSADQVTGPYVRASRNPLLLSADHTYFSRFLPLDGGTVLVNHQSNSDLGWHIAPLKKAVVDGRGDLRLVWWRGNAKLKGQRLSPKRLGGGGLELPVPVDLNHGAVIEGKVRLPDVEEPPVGLRLLLEGGKAYDLRVQANGACEVGEAPLHGMPWKAALSMDRQRHFPLEPRFRLLLRRGMLEFYLDEELILCFRLQGAGTLNLLGIAPLSSAPQRAMSDLKLWAMSL